MHAHPYEPPAEIRLTEAETIALAYRRAAHGDTWAALVRAVEDALTQVAEARRQVEEIGRHVSRGYVRSSVPTAAASEAA